ncbi:c-di-AMP phosphodiesterase, consists of a GGDEF-like and DHH domains [Clostridium sp. DSM 8431]|uniref:DHH family phosphoesterase n=1 Tax=Clostridium sp. DSM 8431 TaxID=1761781 RepID=UPI0008E58DA0|nr:DHH family phosphoesterase [Clostridium sp. DSM 8431]SFU62617.1 c-di-AMP phosphodiesterase, consists of a GGDEF-like and DHH domains [Clostridium sp. DSM 8431]
MIQHKNILLCIISFCMFVVAAILIFFGSKIFSIIVLMLSLVENLFITYYLARKEKDMNNFTSIINSSIKENLFNLVAPTAMVDESGNLIWYNNLFEKNIKGNTDENQNIVDIVRGINIEKIFSGEELSAQRLKINDRLYDISSNQVMNEEHKFFMIYFNDITRLTGVVNTKDNIKESIFLIEVDNLSEALDMTDEDDKPLVVAEIERTINAYALRLNAMIKKYDTNKYVLSVQDRYLQEEIESNFPILNEVSKINKGNRLELTISIGIGRGGVSPYENNTFATVAKELALGRGGDQVVIKCNDDLRFFGGNSKEIEKRTRVRARVVSHALKELIYDSSKVYIVGHKNPDMDCFGSAVALSSIIRQLGKSCSIILNNDTSAIDYFLDKLKKEEKYSDRFISPGYANTKLDDETLVIIVDVHNKSYVSNEGIVEKAKRKVIIDHHRRSADIIQGTMLNYIEVYASSTSEMITEIIQYMTNKPEISKEEAEGLLAGIFMDTKGFTLKTGVRTFDAASFLKNKGADTIEVKNMFTDNLENYLTIAETIKSADVDFEKKIAIAVCPDNVSSVIVAKSADELLTISGIKVSFVLSKIGDEIYISGRSVGDINVQVVLEALGGGGHMNIAATKLSNVTIDEAKDMLKESIEKYLRIGE